MRHLPRGRHGLAREEVAASQRGRLRDSVIAAVAEHGYHGTTVAHIVRGARVSRETFYEHFASKADCFGMALEATAVDIAEIVEAALSGPGDRLERFDAFLRVYLDWLVADPAIARCHLLELRNAGPALIKAGNQWTERLVDRLAEVMATEDRFACEMFVAGMVRLVHTRLELGEETSLVGLRAPLMATVRRYLASDAIATPA